MTEKVKMTAEQCRSSGGHCWIEDPIVTTVDIMMRDEDGNTVTPKTYRRSCKHCGHVQVGNSQPSIAWRDDL